jgi:hypothetical protein
MKPSGGLLKARIPIQNYITSQFLAAKELNLGTKLLQLQWYHLFKKMAPVLGALIST